MIAIVVTAYVTGALTTGALSYILDETETPAIHAARGLTWFLVLPIGMAGRWKGEFR
jgi:hypothetical protein